jgi:hypothetical protein
VFFEIMWYSLDDLVFLILPNLQSPHLFNNKGYSNVPHGEVWVLEGGKVLTEGTHFLSPFSKVKAVKNTDPISFGVVSPALNSKGPYLFNSFLKSTPDHS